MVRMRSYLGSRAFTLIELLAVIAIVGILGVATIASYQAIANDMQQAGAVEAVKSGLARARAVAIQSSKPTLIAFRPIKTAPGEQLVEVVLAQFGGDVYDWEPTGTNSVPAGTSLRLARFVPVSGEVASQLPRGVAIAAMGHQFSRMNDNSTLACSGDRQFLPTSHLIGKSGIPEAPGVIPAVMFAGDGTVASRLTVEDADWCFVDFNNDGVMRYEGDDYCNYRAIADFNPPEPCPEDVPDGTVSGFAPETGCYLGAFYNAGGAIYPNRNLVEEMVPMCHRRDGDEPFVLITPVLAVYDADTARKEYDALRWPDTNQGASARGHDLTDIINKTARVLRFNGYSGIVMEGSTQ